MKNDPVVAALAALDDVPVHTLDGRKRLAKALASKSNLAAAKAARIAAEAQWRDLTEELAEALHRILARAPELDKGCVALTAIARAVYQLERLDAITDRSELFLAGMRHRQPEPVWGGSVDSAAELRAVCAMGLAATAYPDKLRALVDLLADSEWQARAGAARALASTGSDAATLLLRFKALTGDTEPEVLSDCFAGLLALAGDTTLGFIARFAESRDEQLRETALLALGASRRADAVAWLMDRYGAVADVPTRQCVLLALATSRTDCAIDFLLRLIREGGSEVSAMAVSAMEINRTDYRMREMIGEATRGRPSGG